MCEDRFWHTTGTLAALLPVWMRCCRARTAVKCIDNQRDSRSLLRVQKIAGFAIAVTAHPFDRQRSSK